MTFDDTPIFWDTAARRPGRHRWVDEPDTGPLAAVDPPTGPIQRGASVARHGDDDGDGIANQADPDWLGDLGDFEPEASYVFPDPGWRPPSDFTGEWVEDLVAVDTATEVPA